MTDKMRSEFEEWAKKNELLLRRSMQGTWYLFEETEIAWQAWQAARTVPDGYVMVPVEPTQEMELKGNYSVYWDDNFDGTDAAIVYKAMLSAAPEGKK